jgi:hypothetical protein
MFCAATEKRLPAGLWLLVIQIIMTAVFRLMLTAELLLIFFTFLISPA